MHFDGQWGFREAFSNQTSEGWEEFSPEHIKNEILRRARASDLSSLSEWATAGRNLFEENRERIISILEARVGNQKDAYIERLRDETRELSLPQASDFVGYARPSQIASSDTLAITQGPQTPPYFELLAQALSLRTVLVNCRKLAKIAQNAGAHLRRVEQRRERTERVGTNVFIGHGHSRAWKDLKDFLQDRVRLPWDEFNRVPVAGITNIARLSEMLDSAVIAFLVFTAEDEQIDGQMRARENVVHEAGLFQGRLGFTRAIILLEEGCKPFSNIEGLGQIRFPKGNISACFEQVRQVLEREGIIEP